ncbi:response regulator [Candidatus Pacearchaeota archaeon]|nr:response regulator [Candidatus Pacearchaeota archaeon]
MRNTILIADDGFVERRILKAIIRRDFEFYNVTSYIDEYNLRFRLDKTTDDVALVVTDNNMPNSDEGLEIIRDYAPKLIRVPFILVSACVNVDEIAKMAKEAGAYAFVQKPLHDNKITEVIQNALEKYAKN